MLDEEPRFEIRKINELMMYFTITDHRDSVIVRDPGLGIREP